MEAALSPAGCWVLGAGYLLFTLPGEHVWEAVSLDIETFFCGVASRGCTPGDTGADLVRSVFPPGCYVEHWAESLCSVNSNLLTLKGMARSLTFPSWQLSSFLHVYV